MRRQRSMFLILIVVHLFGSLSYGDEQEAGFDCKKAKTKIEIAICGNGELRKLDKTSSDLYKTIMSEGINNIERETLKKEQVDWISKRNHACVTGDIAKCLKKMYETRIVAQQEFAKRIKLPGESAPELKTVNKDLVDKAWSLLKPESAKDYYDIEITEIPNAKDHLVLRALKNEDRQLLLAVFLKSGSKLTLEAKSLDEVSSEGVEPEQSALIEVDWSDRKFDINPKAIVFGLHPLFAFNSESTHCHTQKLQLFHLDGKNLDNVLDVVIDDDDQGCDGDATPTKKKVIEVSAHETLGFHDIVVRGHKKTETYKWDGMSYIKDVPTPPVKCQKEAEAIAIEKSKKKGNMTNALRISHPTEIEDGAVAVYVGSQAKYNYFLLKMDNKCRLQKVVVEDYP